jgi:hypothetical protein
MKRLRTSLATLLLAACGAPLPAQDAGLPPNDGTLSVVPFTAPTGSDVNDAVLVTVTGEGAATAGLDFPPASGNDPYFLDGWALSFEHVIVTVGSVTMSANPDLNANDQSQTGAAVAQALGPWAVDLAKGGALPSKQLNGTSVALARLENQNLVTGRPAFETVSKYALGFDLIVPAGQVQNVNLDAAGLTALQAMNAKGFTVWYQGTATWKGAAGTPACRQTVSPYDFGRYAQVVHFTIGFKAPVTFENCVNPELSPDNSRGLQTQPGAQTTAQLTFHLDHPFWEALEEDSPLRFDALAGRTSVAADAGVALAELSQSALEGLDVFALTDAQGALIPWRTCGPLLTPERNAGTVSIDPKNVPVNPAGGTQGLKDVLDAMTWNLSSFGHLNNDGLCFPNKHFPSPR